MNNERHDDDWIANDDESIDDRSTVAMLGLPFGGVIDGMGCTGPGR